MYRFLLLIFVLTPFVVLGQIKTIGTPKIINYPKSEYGAGTQNWDIAQDKNGIIYFANNDGILRFDGINWELIPTPRYPVRSIIIDSQERIFIGMSNDFGELKRDNSGVYKFKSLKHLIPEQAQSFDEVWRIHEIKQKIIFQSYEYVFVFQDNKIEVIQPREQFLFSFNVNGRLFLQEPGVGIFEYFNWNIDLVPWAGELKDKEVWSILDMGDNQLIIGTVDFGFYIYNRGVLKKWDTPASSFVTKNKLYSATRLSGNYYAFGTILEGMIICDSDGNIVQKLSHETGLQNNTILCLFADKDDNLWLGLDNGIDYLEVNSPLSYITLEQGIGTGYCCCENNGYLYLGTNQGLFARPFNRFGPNNYAPFELVENTEGQVWSLGVFDNQVICGHNIGTFIVETYKARKISDEPGAWKYIRLKQYPDLLLGGHYNGLTLLNKGEDGWKFFQNISGFNESSRFITEDEDNNIWVSHGERGVFRLQLNEKLDSVVKEKRYDAKNGLPHEEHNILLNVKDKWYVSAIDGLYTYDKVSDSFFKDSLINSVFDTKSRIKYIDTDYRNNYWFIAENEAGLIRRNEDLSYTKITTPFKQLYDRFVNEFEFLSSLTEDNVFIGLEDGFAHYTSRIPKSYSKPFPAFITRVELPYLDSVVYVNKQNSLKYEFPFRKNSIRFYFAAPFYENPGQLQFSYFVENYSSEWSQWSSDTYRDFNNLPEQKYIFKLKARNIFDVESEIAMFEFEIMPPWYRSRFAYYFYIFSFILIIVIITWLIQRNLEKSKQKERIQHQQELNKKEEYFQQQALITDKEIIRLKNDKLEAEKIFLDKELANQTMSIIQKNKFLMKLNQELKKIQAETADSSVKTKMAVLKKRINKEIDSEKQNKVFESYFDEVHDDFFKRLKEKYPQLSPKDLRLCAYIRMNISTKEIASLLNISDRGVEISRYRLRKKMELTREVNLSTFLSNI